MDFFYVHRHVEILIISVYYLTVRYSTFTKKIEDRPDLLTVDNILIYFGLQCRIRIYVSQHIYLIYLSVMRQINTENKKISDRG